MEKNGKPEIGLYYFAAFGAASIGTTALVLLLGLLFAVTGTSVPITSVAWLFLFLFPSALVLSCFFISSHLRGAPEIEPLPAIIVGYAAYSLTSFLILVLGGRGEPLSWALLVLICISLSIFNTGRIFERLTRAGSPLKGKEESPLRFRGEESSPVVTKESQGKPAISIRQPEAKADQPKEASVVESQGEVIHLGSHN